MLIRPETMLTIFTTDNYYFYEYAAVLIIFDVFVRRNFQLFKMFQKLFLLHLNSYLFYDPM